MQVSFLENIILQKIRTISFAYLCRLHLRIFFFKLENEPLKQNIYSNLVS